MGNYFRIRIRKHAIWLTPRSSAAGNRTFPTVGKPLTGHSSGKDGFWWPSSGNYRTCEHTMLPWNVIVCYDVCSTILADHCMRSWLSKCTPTKSISRLSWSYSPAWITRHSHTLEHVWDCTGAGRKYIVMTWSAGEISHLGVNWLCWGVTLWNVYIKLLSRGTQYC